MSRKSFASSTMIVAGGRVGREGWVPGVLVFALYLMFNVYENEDLVTHL